MLLYLNLALTFTSAFLYGGLTLKIFLQKKRSRISTLTMVLYFFIFLWGMMSTFFLGSEDFRFGKLFFQLSSIGWIFVPAVVSHTLLARTDEEFYLKNKAFMAVFYFVPFILSCSVFIFDNMMIGSDLIREPWGWSLRGSVGNPWLWAFVFYEFLYLLFGIITMIRWIRNQKTLRLFHRVSLIMQFILIVVLISGITDMMIPISGIQFPSITLPVLGIIGVFIMYSQVRNRLSTSVSEVSTDQILESILDYLLILDMNGTILDCNELVTSYLGKSKKELIGEKLYNTELKNIFDEEDRSMLLEEKEILNVEITFDVDNEPKTFIKNSTIIEDTLFGERGFLISLSDITIRTNLEKQLTENYEEEKEMADIYFKLANYDTLTEAFNRRYFFEVMNKRKSMFGDEVVFEIYFMDLNDFKQINDTYGHHIGDAILSGIAKRMMKLNQDFEMLVRMGGDEFLIARIKAEEDSNNKEFIDKIRQCFIDPFQLGEHSIQMTTSIGWDILRPAEEIDRIISEADRRMYVEKSRKTSRKR